MFFVTIKHKINVKRFQFATFTENVLLFSLSKRFIRNNNSTFVIREEQFWPSQRTIF